jgi:hypothetical protein
MNPNIKFFLLCPIPEDQKPINEYIQLKGNVFLALLKKNSVPFLFVLLIILMLNKIFLFLFFILFFFLFFRFYELSKKLIQSRIVYEEASWYDSQIWEKPFIIIKNDKLIYNQFVKKFKKQLFFFLFLFFPLSLFFQIFS